MGHIRSALYLDFDNVFSGLFKLDPEVAIQFASSPGTWLRRLATPLTDGDARRWLILRCYLNPAGAMNHRDSAGESTRLYFSQFRTAFVRAGFEVVDCPRYSSTKNGADIRIVMDALDALSAGTGYDEFVIASGDSDMTPLLQRLRSADRRTMIVSSVVTAEAFASIADRTLNTQQLLALVQGESVDFDDDAGDVDYGDVGDGGGRAGLSPADHGEAYESFRALVVAEYDGASAPLNMATLAGQLRAQLGEVISASNWFGHGSFVRALKSLDLPDLQLSQHELWNQRRHTAPESAGTTAQHLAVPEPIDRLAERLNLPRLAQEWWPPIYRTLSDYANSHRFNLTECTSWARDRLHEQGFNVSRGVAVFVVRGTSFGGCPLYRQPPPTAEEIAAAFVNNLLHLADGDEIALTDQETAEVKAWLGAELPETAPSEDAPAP
ncbi:NYN domain-containing protein [Actinomadura rugatobispora]|uniref:NYN domain-containing protein n=1 Tax=Actinomadura rugatobispora TaxID=1994 RepID=A0ABW0ZW18_9ACTN|nr:NYN domain-containing protein [Actinomadura rugatobispora]